MSSGIWHTASISSFVSKDFHFISSGVIGNSYGRLFVSLISFDNSEAKTVGTNNNENIIVNKNVIDILSLLFVIEILL